MRRRWSRLDVTVRDAVLAGVLTVAVQVELVAGADRVEGSLLLQHLAFTLITASVALRRRAPLAAAALTGVGLVAQTLVGVAPVATGMVVLLVVVYSVATYASRRDAVLGLLAVLVSIAVYPFTVDDVQPADELVNAMIPTVVWVLARLARERLDRSVVAERERVEQVQAAERAREQALAAQRRQIARELHDTVAHGVTLMLLQTEVLRDRHGDSEPLEVVQAAGRACIDDLRRLLVVLRSADEPVQEPLGTAHLPTLVASVRATGTPVELTAPAAPCRLPASLDVAVFRVVQEGLTNALRYAGGSGLRVGWSVTDRAVDVVVEDDGPRGVVPAQPGSGQGLLGVRERVALHGGHLAAGPRPDGTGWRLHAVLPLEVPAAL